MEMNITLYPLHDYNCGILNPFTIDLAGSHSPENYREAICKGLWEKSRSGNVLSICCPDCGYVGIAQTLDDVDNFCPTCGMGHLEQKLTNEEWIVCDYEGIPETLVGEYDLDIKGLLEYKEALEESGLDKEAFDAGIKLGIPPGSVQETYYGAFGSDEDFAYSMAEETDCLKDDVAWPYSCVDWELAARDLMQDFYEQDGHYFGGH